MSARMLLMLGMATTGLMPAALAAQQCVSPATGHYASADYGVAPIAGTPADAAQLEVGFTYGTRVDAAALIGRGNDLVIDGSWHNGRLDVRGGTRDDGASFRTRAAATSITRLGRGVSVCAVAGAGYAISRSPWGPSRFIDVPVGLGFGATISAGGMKLMPFLLPLATYWARFDQENATSGRVERADNGIALLTAMGVAVRIGRIEVRASSRNGDPRLSGAQTQVQAAVWF
ncbi:MAG: hypothetical protein SFW08_00485 [Gemmatimonadaceae bacterium]|nr:hypothetical protein [Gemmatimonadaceae bacterium]